MIKVSVIGAGTMGAGIAQIAATNGHEVCLYDSFDGAIENAEKKLIKILNRLVEKERITKEENKNILTRPITRRASRSKHVNANSCKLNPYPGTSGKKHQYPWPGPKKGANNDASSNYMRNEASSPFANSALR